MLRLFVGVVVGVIFAEPLRDAAKNSWHWFSRDENKGDETDNTDETISP